MVGKRWVGEVARWRARGVGAVARDVGTGGEDYYFMVVVEDKGLAASRRRPVVAWWVPRRRLKGVFVPVEV